MDFYKIDEITKRRGWTEPTSSSGFNFSLEIFQRISPGERFHRIAFTVGQAKYRVVGYVCGPLQVLAIQIDVIAVQFNTLQFGAAGYGETILTVGCVSFGIQFLREFHNNVSFTISVFVIRRRQPPARPCQQPRSQEY